MSEAEDLAVWENYYPGRKLPGVAEPVSGNCNSKLRSKELKSLNITRYCSRNAGYGTDHKGSGTCKLHLGNTPNHVRGAMRVLASNELVTMSERLGDPPPIGPPEVEAFLLLSKVKQWSLMIEGKLDQLNDEAWVTDKAGIEHTRALIELMERAHDRFQAFLEFSMKYNLQRRVVELEENQARLIGDIYLNIILSQELGLKEAQVDLARSMWGSAMNSAGDALSPSWSSGIIDAEVIG